MVAGHSLDSVTHRFSDDESRAECECGWSSDWCRTETGAVGQWHDHTESFEQR
jgi:hypothetical protein